MYSVLVHYGELALKGRNRPWFVSMLVRPVTAVLPGLDVQSVKPVVGRLVMRLGIPSPEIERVVGARVQAVTGWNVDLSTPDLVIGIEVLSTDAFFYFRKEPGVGGLPIGTSGKVLCLMSGGIDSPVAAWRLIRRGARAIFVHFHSYPILSRASQEKARELVRQLTAYQLRSRLYLVPFGGLQQQVVLTVPPPLRVVVYRRLMMRIAERLALESGARALVTGDAVGQVASQTLANLQAVGEVVRLPVLRPLIGFHKEEITQDAIRIGTYQTSIVKDDDCCTLFTPRYPTTGARPGEAEVAERELDVAALIEKTIAEVVVEDYVYPRAGGTEETEEGVSHGGHGEEPFPQ